MNYELGSLIGIREELMDGDLRALYIAWLASQSMWGGDDDDEEDDEEISVPPVPPAFGELTAAQQALAELLQVPEELLAVAARHSSAVVSSTSDDVTAWLPLLPPGRRDDYLMRLARNEPGLSRLLVRELRELGRDRSREMPSTAERVPFATLLAESRAMKLQLAREKLEQERLARQRHLQNIHERQDDNWRQVGEAVARGSGAGYAEAVQLLVELRDASEQFNETREFQERFRAWVQPYLRRPALVRRLQENKFTLPEA
ncbi:MAG TPA: hypothetical protein VEL31_31260 [Ktedonobacteraceae bacterium]|nr:hypothetical protein [Ktedonobacteraceae bacterium]